MIAFDKLVALFDLSRAPAVPVERPTSQSIAAINSHFGISLPPMLIEFSRRSEKFGCYFASLGEDYSSPFHIIPINRQAARIRRRRQRQWQYVKPPYLLVINHGYDDDYDCLDLRAWNSETGDYRLQYWAPDVADLESEKGWATFHEYLEEFALPDLKRLRGEERTRVLEILNR